MKAFKFILAGGAGIAALAAAAPASAQYYPGYGYGGGNVIGQVLNQVLGGGYGAYGGYGMNSQLAVNQCSAAVSDRVNRQYGGYGAYGAYGNYGGGARVVQITSVEPRSGGRVRVRGIVQSNAYNAGYGGGYPQDFAFKCNIDYRGYISDIDLDRLNSNYGNYGYNGAYGGGYAPYGNYRRY
jgi:hypothetical protein